jgi:hypothetical protein
VIVRILQIPLALVTWLTTFISGLLSAIPLLGFVYVLAVTFIWQLFLWPLVGCAWLWSRLPAWLSWPSALLGIPLAIVGDVFLKLTGALSADPDDRLGHLVKQSICQQWPYAFSSATEGTPLIRAMQEERHCSFVRAVLGLNDALVRRQLGLP